MNGEYFVRLALHTLKCTQKDLASHLGVSSTQISKWKKGNTCPLIWKKSSEILHK
ncbi:helix-turn-helix domain-containing protein [Escherichia coli]